MLRPPHIGIGEYVAEFGRLNNRVKPCDMVLPEAVLACKFLNNASISDSNKKLIQATLTESSVKERFEFVI